MERLAVFSDKLIQAIVIILVISLIVFGRLLDGFFGFWFIIFEDLMLVNSKQR